jgi:hypothetical protein
MCLCVKSTVGLKNMYRCACVWGRACKCTECVCAKRWRAFVSMCECMYEGGQCECALAPT